MWKINKSEALAGNKEATEWDRTESKAARDEKCVKIYDQMWHEAIRVCARSVLAAAINLTREAFRRGLESWEENFRKVSLSTWPWCASFRFTFDASDQKCFFNLISH